MRVTEPYTIFSRTLKSGKTVYYYQFRDEYGRRSSAKSTGCTSLSEAKRFCQKLYNQNQFTVTSKSTFGAYTENFFDESSTYLKWREVNNRAIKPETLRQYKKSLNYQLLPFFADIKLDKISPDTIKQWIIWASEKWSGKTINNAQGVLNIIFESAIDNRLIEKNPLTRIGYRKTEKKARELLTIEELNQIYNSSWANKAEQSAFLLCCITGMRIGEVVALHKKDVYSDYLDVKYTLSDKYGLGSTKTGINRKVPIIAEYEFAENQSNWCFSADNTNPIKTHCVYNAFVRICQKLNIDCKSRGITLHTLRNFFISYCQSENVPLQKIKAVVGHADTSMTEHYTYWTSDMYSEIYKVQQELIKLIRSKK